MESIPTQAAVAFGVHCFILAAQGRHIRGFQGASQVFLLILNLSMLLGNIASLVFLVRYGWLVAWWVVLPLLGIGFAAALASASLVRPMKPAELITSAGGIVAWPVAAHLMFRGIPA